jgi:hypothetical protein
MARPSWPVTAHWLLELTHLARETMATCLGTHGIILDAIELEVRARRLHITAYEVRWLHGSRTSHEIDDHTLECENVTLAATGLPPG